MMLNLLLKIRLVIIANIFWLFACPVIAATIDEIEPNNPETPSFIEFAYNIDPFFTTELNDNVGDISGANISERSSHVSINGTGDGTYDYYSFTVPSEGITGVFDIDFGDDFSSSNEGVIDSMIALWNDDGLILSQNDDSSTALGAGGSSSSLDSFIQYDFNQPGLYIIGVAECCGDVDQQGWLSPRVREGGTYTLQVALGTGFSPIPPPSEIPVPPALYLFCSGIVLLFRSMRTVT